MQLCDRAVRWHFLGNCCDDHADCFSLYLCYSDNLFIFVLLRILFSLVYIGIIFLIEFFKINVFVTVSANCSARQSA